MMEALIRGLRLGGRPLVPLNSEARSAAALSGPPPTRVGSSRTVGQRKPRRADEEAQRSCYYSAKAA